MSLLLDHEREAWQAGSARVAGIDEAGRGPLAGPVVAAAVLFDRTWLEREADGALKGLNDSKQLSPSRRELFFARLTSDDWRAVVSYGVAEASVEEIDALNILRATHLAMRRAVEKIAGGVDLALVDGLPVHGLPVPHKAIVKGDASSLSIAAASVLAKVTRDHLMVALDAQYPGYGFAAHKGYGTAAHLKALAQLGPSPVHRRSFAPVNAVQLSLFE